MGDVTGAEGGQDPSPGVGALVDALVDTWFSRHTHDWRDWDLADLLAAKQASGTTVSLVVPARNEAATVGAVVSKVREALMGTTALLDEIVVIDSDSEDATYAVATDAGAVVHRAADIRPDLGAARGKGEAMWKSQFVTTGDVLVFMDADLTDWDTHFVPGLLGPLLTDDSVHLVKGFYQRPLAGADDTSAFEGGRVTELVARPLIAVDFPALAGVIQPLAGEWAVRRGLFASLSVPTGYGVEMAALVDTARLHGVAAIAQVGLGRRAHNHQTLRDLGAMATQIYAVAQSRRGRGDRESVVLRQYHPEHGHAEALTRSVPTGERPPADQVDPRPGPDQGDR